MWHILHLWNVPHENQICSTAACVGICDTLSVDFLPPHLFSVAVCAAYHCTTTLTCIGCNICHNSIYNTWPGCACYYDVQGTQFNPCMYEFLCRVLHLLTIRCIYHHGTYVSSLLYLLHEFHFLKEQNGLHVLLQVSSPGYSNLVHNLCSIAFYIQLLYSAVTQTLYQVIVGTCLSLLISASPRPALIT